MKRILIPLVLAMAFALPAQAQYTPAPFVLQQYFDNTGAVLDEGGMCVFVAGTSTLATSYATASGTPNANPLIFNSAGRPSSNGFFLTPGSSYKLILKDFTGVVTPTCVPDSGVTIWTQDNIQAVPRSDANVDVTGTAGGNISAGQAAYVGDGTGGTTPGQWYRADADAAASSSLPYVGLALGDAIAGQSIGIRVSGRATSETVLSAGTHYYVSGTPGALSSTPGVYPRYIGQAQSTSEIYLGPDPRVQAPITSTITTTGTVAALAIPCTNQTAVFANNATALTIQGIVACFDGQQLAIFSKGAGQVDLANQSGSAAASDRIINGVTGTISLAAGVGRVLLEYDSTTARWRVMDHEQGAWITPTFAAGDFTGSGAMTWTVAAGDVTTYAYYLRGRALTVAYRIVTATIGGGSDRPVNIKIPGGFTAAKTMDAVGRSVDNGGAMVAGAILVSGGATTIGHFATVSSLTGNWTNPSADNMQAIGQITIEVQ